MTYDEIMTMMTETRLPFAYDHFAEGESPDSPFIVFLFPSANNFGADGKVYQKINRLRLELYTDRKQPATEKSVESVLERYGLFFVKTEVWIAEERLYEVVFEMEVLDNG